MKILDVPMIDPALLAANLNGGSSVRLGLFKNNITITPETLLADLVEMDAAWYFSPFIGFSGANVGENGQIYATNRDSGFQRNDDSDLVDEVTYGWFLSYESSPLPQLLAAGNDRIDWLFPEQQATMWLNAYPNLGAIQNARING